MTYLKLTNNQKKKNTKINLFIGFVILFIFILHLIFPGFYLKIFSPIISVVWKSENSSSSFLFRTFKMFSSKNELIKENENLKLQINSLNNRLLITDSLMKENSELKQILERGLDKTDVLGVVLSRPPASPYDTFIIDIGREKGVRAGDNVYVDGVVLIGTIKESINGMSKVGLFSSPGNIVSVIVGSSSVPTEALGKGGGNFEVRLPIDIKVERNDAVTLSQLRNHVFGLVEEIIVDSTNSLQTVLFKSPINIHNVKFVEVETSQW